MKDKWGNTRLVDWRVAGSWIATTAMSNERLKGVGYKTLLDTYLEWYPK
jgi:hypothetical protein